MTPQERLVDQLVLKHNRLDVMRSLLGAVDAIVPLLDDPVPRVRRNAAHAVGCVACKPDWDGRLEEAAIDRLGEMAALDSNAKVREEAVRTLACTR